jgi:hypothetical protein
MSQAAPLYLYPRATSDQEMSRQGGSRGITQGDDSSRDSDSFTPGRRAANGWVVPGSHLFEDGSQLDFGSR